jgi:3-methyladenine DNA glycosylase/8-oxoguanine DNA glycosylase
MLSGGGSRRGAGGRSALRRLEDGRVELRITVRPRWAFRLRPKGTPDGLLRLRGGALQRLVHVDAEPVLAGVVQPARDRVVFGARARGEGAAAVAIERLRFATGVDDDLEPFHAQFRDDPLLGRVLRAHPGLRPTRRPDPFEALLAAITEQLIEFDRAIEIQRRLIAVLGRRCAETGLRDAPTPAAVAGAAPAQLEAFDLAGRRCLTLRRAAAEVARGRVDLRAADHERGWRRLRSIPGVGPWTIEMLAFLGQGRHDQVAAGDLGFLKLVGRLTTGNPKARADEEEVRGFFEPYGAWKGLAGEYLRLAAATGLLGAPPAAAPGVSRSARAPGPAGTRSSAPARRSAAA